jgi:cell division protein ZipA
MNELRLSLLTLGVGFILGLLAWEWWRRRQAAETQRRDQQIIDGRATLRSTADDDSEDDIAPLPISAAPDATREPVLGALPVVEMGQRLDAQIQPDVDRYGIGSEAETVVLDPADMEPPPTVRVDWPDEAVRQIVGLRVVARTGMRFSGLRVRQALVGDGYLFGEFQIYHRPGADGRVLVSAASLAKPGYFEPAKMDTQTFSGLNLFAVLPGPLPPVQAFDTLLVSARSIAQRLGGDVSDSSGAPLNDERIQEMRNGLRERAAVERAAGTA